MSRVCRHEVRGPSFLFQQEDGWGALEILNGSLLQSPIYEIYGKIIIGGKFPPPGFAFRLGLKDLRLVLSAADEAAVPMPVASVIRDRFVSSVARGWGDLDWAALAEVVAEDAGL